MLSWVPESRSVSPERGRAAGGETDGVVPGLPSLRAAGEEPGSMERLSARGGRPPRRSGRDRGRSRSCLSAHRAGGAGRRPRGLRRAAGVRDRTDRREGVDDHPLRPREPAVVGAQWPRRSPVPRSAWRIAAPHRRRGVGRGRPRRSPGQGPPAAVVGPRRASGAAADPPSRRSLRGTAGGGSSFSRRGRSVRAGSRIASESSTSSGGTRSGAGPRGAVSRAAPARGPSW